MRQTEKGAVVMKDSRGLITRTIPVLVLAALLAALVPWANPSARYDAAAQEEWQKEFNVAQRPLTTTGASTYFVLMPGYQLVLESSSEKVTITVLDETRVVGGVTTRVVEERTEVRGELDELARNFIAMDATTGDVFYFGEEVDYYKEGVVVSHDGSWLAYVDGSQPGLFMPGTPVVGMKYYQEVAPGIAEDRAEVLSTTETVTVPAGTFANSLRTREDNPLDPGAIEEKVYALGVGFIQEGSLRLVSHGYR
jgi:hypothetical protein